MIQISEETKAFAEEYSLWILSEGMKYIHCGSEQFTIDNKMDIFIKKYYGKNWMNV